MPRRCTPCGCVAGVCSSGGLRSRPVAAARPNKRPATQNTTRPAPPHLRPGQAGKHLAHGVLQPTEGLTRWLGACRRRSRQRPSRARAHHPWPHAHAHHHAWPLGHAHAWTWHAWSRPCRETMDRSTRARVRRHKARVNRMAARHTGRAGPTVQRSIRNLCKGSLRPVMHHALAVLVPRPPVTPADRPPPPPLSRTTHPSCRASSPCPFPGLGTALETLQETGLAWAPCPVPCQAPCRAPCRVPCRAPCRAGSLGTENPAGRSSLQAQRLQRHVCGGVCGGTRLCCVALLYVRMGGDSVQATTGRVLVLSAQVSRRLERCRSC